MLERGSRNESQKTKGLARLSEIIEENGRYIRQITRQQSLGKILASCVMFERVYEKAHPAAIALAEVRPVVDFIDNWGAAVFTAVMLPPHAGVVTPTDGKMNSAEVHDCCKSECPGFAELVEGEGG